MAGRPRRSRRAARGRSRPPPSPAPRSRRGRGRATPRNRRAARRSPPSAVRPLPRARLRPPVRAASASGRRARPPRSQGRAGSSDRASSAERARGRPRRDDISRTYAHRVLDRPLEDLLSEARSLRSGDAVTYSPKVFIPLTKLCRDVCHYCTFARPPRRGERAYLSSDEVLAIARAGAEAGCREALFTLGDKPELRYRAARDELAGLGCETTIEYLVEMC